MFSSHTQAGARIAIEALQLGASDVVGKPTSGNLLETREALLSRIKALCSHGTDSSRLRRTATAAAVPPARPAPSVGALRVDVVVVAISTGGPNALTALLPRLPRDLPVPLLVVQHMPPVFTRILAERLASKSQIGVEEAAAGAEVAPGRVYIAPGDHHLTVERVPGGVRLSTNQAAHENSCRPSADCLFRSAAEVYGEHVLAVVMTGMGQDGLRGCQRIYAGGGQIIIQDEASSVVWGMPGAVAKAGLADAILPLDGIADEIVRRTRKPKRHGAGDAGSTPAR